LLVNNLLVAVIDGVAWSVCWSVGRSVCIDHVHEPCKNVWTEMSFGMWIRVCTRNHAM